MASKTKETKAQEALEIARQEAATCTSWTEFWNSLFGIGGKPGELFPTQSECIAFSKTKESKEIMRMLEELQGEEDLPEKLALARGQFLLRLPKSLHAALMAEAQAKGVSLNQLCMAKLATQLRASVQVQR